MRNELASLIAMAKMRTLKYGNRNYSAAEDLMKTRALYNHFKEAVICQDTEEKTH